MRSIRPQGRLSLLIVHGDEDVRRWLELVAEESELFWSIRSVADGRFALEHIWTALGDRKQVVPDIVLTDFSTAGLSALQVTRELRRYTELRGLFVAFATSAGGPAEQDAAENAGCDFFVRRPQAVDDMIAVYRQIAKRCMAKNSMPHRVLN